MSVCCECCVLSGRGLCDVLITRPEESYRLWCVVVCGMKTSRMRPWPSLGRRAAGKMQYVGVYCLGEVLCYTMKYGTKRNFIIGICFLKTKNWTGRNEVTETSGRLHPLWPQNKWLHTPRTTDYRHTRQDRWIQTEVAFTLAKNATKPNPFEIIPLQTTRKENNWKNEEALARAAVTLETERIRGMMMMMNYFLCYWRKNI